MSRKESAESTAIAPKVSGLREARFLAPNPPEENPNTPRLRGLGMVIAAVVIWLLWRRLPWLALFVVITGAGSSLLDTVVKSSVHRLRPVLTDPVAREPGLR